MLSHWKMIYGELIHIVNQKLFCRQPNTKRHKTLMMSCHLSNIIFLVARFYVVLSVRIILEHT